MAKIGTGILETTAKKTFADYKLTIDGRQATFDAEVLEPSESCRIYRNPSKLIGNRTIPSASLVRFGKVKPFIDWVYAAVEDHLSGMDHPSVRGFVAALDNSMRDTVASDYIHTVKKIGQGESSSKRKPIHQALETFEDELGLSLPQGFYLWTEKLKRHYRQRKALGTVPGFFFGREDEVFNQQVIDDLKRTIQANPNMRKEYEAIVKIYSQMTDPPRDVNALFPQARVPDQEYFLQLSEERGDDIPEGLGKAFADAVRSGKIDLTPTETSGLFTRQLFELDPLVKMDTDEFKKYFPGERYGKLMENEFISQWAATRHTHVGSIDHNMMMMAAMAPRQPPIVLSPKVKVEPFFTIYERMADNLGFLEDVVKNNVPRVLDKPRMMANGELTAIPVGEEFQKLRQLLSGLGLLARDSLHIPYNANSLGKQDRKDAQRWVSRMADDPDINRDMSIFVPIIRESDGKRFVCYVNPGFQSTTLDIEYKQTPEVNVGQQKKPSLMSEPTPDIKFDKQRVEILKLVHKEVRIPKGKLINDEKLRELLPEGDFTEDELNQALATL